MMHHKVYRLSVRADIEITSCIFGLNTRALSSDANFQSLSTTLYTNADDLTLLQQRRLVFGFRVEGVFMPDSGGCTDLRRSENHTVKL